MPSKIVKNKTDHIVNVVYKDENIQYPESDGPIRLDMFDRKLYRIDNGIPVIQGMYQHDESKLPPKECGTLYITSKLIATLYSGIRDDFVFPGTNPRDGGQFENDKLKFVKQFRRPIKLEGYP